MDKPKQNKGFRLWDKEKQLRVASKGGSSVRPELRSFSTNQALAREAGRIGGLKSVAARQAKKLASNS